LRSRHVAPHLIVSSSAVRALTTAQIIADTLNAREVLKPLRELYDLNLWALAEFIRTLDCASQRFFGADECDLKANRYVLRGGVKAAVACALLSASKAKHLEKKPRKTSGQSGSEAASDEGSASQAASA